MTTKEAIIVIIICMYIAASTSVQQGSGRFSFGTGLLYKNGMDITLACEHEMNYRHMWEFFVNDYLQWAECALCGHACPKLFWRNYRGYGFGMIHRPCMTRGCNHYGSLRIGASTGDDMNKFLDSLYFGHERSYALRAEWTLYWQVKSDVIIEGADVLQAGIVLGMKLSIEQGDEKESNMIRRIHLMAVATAAVPCVTCDTHIDVPDTVVRPGHILCEDGTALPYAQYEQSGKKAIVMVFDTEKRGGMEGDGYTVYLWGITPQAFADSLGIAQDTSADIMAYDGNENTFVLYDTQGAISPVAEAVFDLWWYE